MTKDTYITNHLIKDAKSRRPKNQHALAYLLIVGALPAWIIIRAMFTV